MTAVMRTPLTTYTGREDYATDFACGLVRFDAACPRCEVVCEWHASAQWPQPMPQCRCEA